MTRPFLPISERIEQYVLRIPESGCWLWTGSISQEGYGRLNVNYLPRQAHRLAYEVHVGEIPKGLDLDHLCRVRCCVNPAHLEPVTRSENLRRGETGSYLQRKQAAKTHCPKGHSYDGENLVFTKLGYRACRTCKIANWHKWHDKRVARCA